MLLVTGSAMPKEPLEKPFKEPIKTPSSARENVLILGPHEDDEVLMCAGIIEKSLAQGDTVKVAIVTNGDYLGPVAKGETRIRESMSMFFGLLQHVIHVGKGETRIRESMSALNYLGVKPENMYYLGYGDTGSAPIHENISFLRNLYYAATDTTVIESNVGTQTYGIPENQDFHYQKFGFHGSYTRGTLRQNLETLLDEFKPDEIYVTSLYDDHGDHAALYLFVTDAIIEVKKSTPSYAPILHQYLVHADDDSWPDPYSNNNDPLGTFSKPAGWDISTGGLLDWTKREIVNVPYDMQVLPRTSNRKYLAINKYTSQKNGWLYSFAKTEEIFWKKDFVNIAPLAMVSVSSENLATNQQGIKAVDGVAEGYPRFPYKEWASTGEKEGAWIRLRWPQDHEVNRTILYDRPNLDDHILSGTLTFSDGSSINIGQLSNDGVGNEITFEPKTINWVKFTVNSVSGNTKNIGLSEFEVEPISKPH
jgi:LmbE family N-acetylglucosaminyl deacetylase